MAKKPSPKRAAGRKYVPPPAPHLTSFIVRSITPADEKLLIEVCRLTGERTNSGAIGSVIRDYVLLRSRLDALQTKYREAVGIIRSVDALLKMTQEAQATVVDVGRAAKDFVKRQTPNI